LLVKFVLACVKLVGAIIIGEDKKICNFCVFHPSKMSCRQIECYHWAFGGCKNRNVPHCFRSVEDCQIFNNRNRCFDVRLLRQFSAGGTTPEINELHIGANYGLVLNLVGSVNPLGDCSMGLVGFCGLWIKKSCCFETWRKSKITN
jgi:hypothetical protein